MSTAHHKLLQKVEAIIHVQFRKGPGSAKVKSGEYELFDGKIPSRPLLPNEFELLPGMKIVMAIVVGQYQQSGWYRCPRIGCGVKLKRPDVEFMSW